ncbi:DNA polymerase III, epsilon subunit-related 3'-5' exonuclease [Thermoplasmatales archaeon BRNA1]|nr:DNA polymerase III, epsilon subunit-related 3'-5' exonuclease [Thermoplasmatales archaeon BRNA1]
MTLNPLSLLVIDTETTGLSGCPSDHVVDIGAVKVDFGKCTVSDVYEAIPGYDVSTWDRAHRNAWVFKNTSLCLEDVVTSPLPQEVVLRDLRRITSDYPFVTSYNVDFDFFRFLFNEPWDLGGLQKKLAPDPMLVAAELSGGRWPKLDYAYARFCPGDPAGIRGRQDHRALSDARVAAHVILALWKLGKYLLPSTEETSEDATPSLCAGGCEDEDASASESEVPEGHPSAWRGNPSGVSVSMRGLPGAPAANVPPNKGGAASRLTIRDFM